MQELEERVVNVLKLFDKVDPDKASCSYVNPPSLTNASDCQ